MTQASSQVAAPVRPAAVFRTARVLRTHLVTPHMLRITIGGDALAGLVTYGNDQHIKLYFPRPGVELPEPFTAETFLSLPRERRPTLRTYTIREHRPAAREIDIDFVLHGDAGPASRWASQAKPGDSITFAGPRGAYQPDPELDALWLVADETGIPAALAILERLPAGAHARAFLEVEDAREQQILVTAADVDVVWVHRRGVPPGESDRLLEAVRDSTLPEGHVAAWIACEGAVAKAIRRHFVEVRGLDRDRLKSVGYWDRGKSEDDAYDEAQRGPQKD
ncbi:siderophore-interacting protein [Pendulispora albinea]|uniref:Siderophore-interacting protein n=1 Tax=Pendulispora albinea TaxID=2741071 RepID=A0ABZ2LYC8_9BACT